MNVRAQIGMVFHLDKCIGCHTCSLACKNLWTDRPGTEYMWWNNVETKPGTGFPTRWEDQEKYNGGWDSNGKLKSTGKAWIVANIFHHPSMPTMDDYYEPWTYDYDALFSAPEGPDQPVARPISLVTGEVMDIEAGPNWDDDLGGSPVYAANDLNLQALSPEEQQQMFALERLGLFYLPRICNHCLNPSCVAACPSGALYKRGEDGIVLLDQKRCRGWRACVPACPYKKVYYNWSTGKSEKCILCYPRIETGQAPACFHSCVGRIRYLGVLLYDADRIHDAATRPTEELVEAQRSLILDPFDPEVQAAARANDVPESTIEAAQKSPVYQYVINWKMALPLHPEFRTMPMLFYVPPMTPVLSERDGNTIDNVSEDLFHDVDQARTPIKYMASLFSAGSEELVRYALRKQKAVRWYRRAKTVGDVEMGDAMRMLNEADCSAEEADAIYRLTALCTYDERFVIPPGHREMGVEALQDPLANKMQSGFGFVAGPQRGL